MAKYGSKAQKKVSKVMHEYGEGKLKSGSGKKVKSRKQAIAIGISEARHEGDKVPSRKSSKSSKSSSSRKSSGSKSSKSSKSRKSSSSKSSKSRKASGSKSRSSKSSSKKK